MKNLSITQAILLATIFTASVPAQADLDVDTACQTTPDPVPPGGWGELDAELPLRAFRLAILPDAGRSPGFFVATISQHTTAIIELRRPSRVCRLELNHGECPAITEVAQAVEQLNIPIGKDHAAPLERITLHATTYILEVRGSHGWRHSVRYYGEHDNPIAGFMHDARERLLACVPQAIQDFIDPPSNP